MKTDLEIARESKMRPIAEVAARLHIPDAALEPYGRYKAKVGFDFINLGLEPGARAGVELTLSAAKELRASLERAILAAEYEEAEVRGRLSQAA